MVATELVGPRRWDTLRTPSVWFARFRHVALVICDMEPLRLTKLDAAERQLGIAIDLFFSGADLVSAWTLAAAAYNILRDLKEQAGQRDMMFKHQLYDQMKISINPIENFLKHADKDPNAVLIFQPHGQIEGLLVDAGTAFLALAGRETPHMVLARMWFLTNALIQHEGGEQFDRWLKVVKPTKGETPLAYRDRWWTYAESEAERSGTSPDTVTARFIIYERPEAPSKK